MPAKLDDIDKGLRDAISQRLKEIRIGLGKTQKDFAYESGRDKQSYNKNEQGKGATIYTVNKFCIENKLSLGYFFTSPLFPEPPLANSEEKKSDDKNITD